jgi:hypothetical protein
MTLTFPLPRRIFSSQIVNNKMENLVWLKEFLNEININLKASDPVENFELP